jgi:hypothetical protein
MSEHSLDKMKTKLADDGVANYWFNTEANQTHLNPLLGQRIRLEFSGQIFCTHCGKKTKTSFSQGYCYPCAQKLAQCDICIVKPELCHFAKGTCREPEWAAKHCHIDHAVYLSNTSSIKVGITRRHQILNRWIDQGATQGIEIAVVPERLKAGLIEVAIAEHVGDKTNWRKMLSSNAEPLDLAAMRTTLLIQLPANVPCDIASSTPVSIKYPVLAFPTKITSLNAEKTPTIEGCLMGLKGQYLILDCGVINLRKYTGYEARLTSV